MTTRKHVTTEDIVNIIWSWPAGEIDNFKSTDDDLYMTYYVHAREDGTLVGPCNDYDMVFCADLWFWDYLDICCWEYYGTSREDMEAECDDEHFDLDYDVICEVLEDLDYWLFRELCEDLSCQVNDWLESLDEDEDE